MISHVIQRQRCFLNKAYVQDKEVLYKVNIKHDNIDKDIIARYVGDRKFIDSCTGYLYQHRDYKLDIKVLNKMLITQFTEDFDLDQSDKKIVIAEFNNGNTIAIKYNSGYSFVMIEIDKFGYCIVIKQNYFEIILINNKLNRYICKVEQPYQEYKLKDKIEDDEFKFKVLNSDRVRIGKVVEKLDRLDKDYVEEAEIYEV